MATTFSRNLKLRISDDLTSDSKFNLNKLDSLGSVYQTDTNSTAQVRSKTDIQLQTQDPDIGGSGSGGTISFGTVNQPVGLLRMFAENFTLSAPLGLADVAAGGTNSLKLQYKSDLNGVVDLTADRNLFLDVDNSDRSLTLGGDFSLLGANLSLTLTSNLNLTLPPDVGTSGQVLTTDGIGNLTWTNSTAGSLSGLSDVELTSPTDGQVLTYDDTSGKWKNETNISASGVETAFVWQPSDGAIKTIVHNLGTQQVVTTVLDTTDEYQTIEVPSTRPDANTVVLTSSIGPAGGNWLVLLKQIVTN